MCYVAAIPYILMGVGALSSANSKQQQGQAAANAYGYNEQVAKLQEQDALARGADDERRFRAGVRQLVGSQRAGFSGQGVDINSGSPLDVQLDTVKQGELDALTIRNNAFMEAFGFQTAGVNFSMQKTAASAQGNAGALGSILGGLGSMLG